MISLIFFLSAVQLVTAQWSCTANWADPNCTVPLSVNCLDTTLMGMPACTEPSACAASPYGGYLSIYASTTYCVDGSLPIQSTTLPMEWGTSKPRFYTS